MYTYKVNDDATAEIYDPNGILIEVAGPWNTIEGAEVWAANKVYLHNSGQWDIMIQEDR